jgi:hypothetical protein
MIHKFSRNTLAATLGAFALMTLSAPVFAGDSAREAATAATHAGLAAKSTGLQQVHMHLHHAVNCLVGPKGEEFDPDQANPCSGQGNGAIPDAENAEHRKVLESALAAAKLGLASDNLRVAQKQATETETQLKSLAM